MGPTARELIEQADALMRRNRPSVERPAGVVHASPMPEAVSPPPEGPGFGTTAEDALPPAAEPVVVDEFPLLTEAVVASAPGQADDVPLLTEAVEEIDADAVPQAAPPDTEEWEIGELDATSQRGPDSLAPTTVGSEADVPPTRELPDDVVEQVQRWDAQLGIAPGAPLAAAADEDHAQPIDEVPSVDDERAVDAALGLLPDVPIEPPPRVPAHEPDAETAAPMPLAAAASTPVPMPVAAPPASAATAPADEIPLAPVTEPAWSALAEEIRMQVLQRIDIFTDTGLRQQLGDRLKPVVDRASADLVATISQHVGEMLRAYVAEAIEREIESWKRESGGK